MYRLICTIPTGFETTACEEICETFMVEKTAVEKARGRIFFEVISDSQLKKCWQLRSVDNIYVILLRNDKFGFVTNKDHDLVNLKSLVGSCEWRTGLAASDTMSMIEFRHNAEDALNNDWSFRVTCNRTGAGELKHEFTSMEAASAFGAEINDTFGWRVDLTNYDLNVVLTVNVDQVIVAIELTHGGSLHRRNIVNFGPTTLRATICHGLIRLGRPKLGEVVLDPLCGGASIPIEGCVAFPSTIWLAGDSHPLAIERTTDNLNHLMADNYNFGHRLGTIEAFRWDALRLPLVDGIVDLVVTDLPFGKRSGSKTDNRALYPSLLVELARLVKCGSGRAVFLTWDKRNFLKAQHCMGRLWQHQKAVNVNIGGLAAVAFVLSRTVHNV